MNNMKVIVVNKYKHQRNASTIYIGRGSVFGNRFAVSMGRPECIAAYKEKYFDPAMESDTPLRRAVLDIVERVLAGETIYLECFCKPQACHGDVIRDRINDILATLKVSIA